MARQMCISQIMRVSFKTTWARRHCRLLRQLNFVMVDRRDSTRLGNNNRMISTSKILTATNKHRFEDCFCTVMIRAGAPPAVVGRESFAVITCFAVQ